MSDNLSGYAKEAREESIARLRRITGDEQWLYVGTRHSCGGGCDLAFKMGAPCVHFGVLCSRVPVIFCGCLGAALATVLLTAPCGIAQRARAVASFAVVVTPTHVVSTHEDCVCCSCGETPGDDDGEVIEGHNIAHVESTDGPCGTGDVA